MATQPDVSKRIGIAKGLFEGPDFPDPLDAIVERLFLESARLSESAEDISGDEAAASNPSL